MSQYEVYLGKLDKHKLREVGSQKYSNAGHSISTVSKNVETARIKVSRKITQCWEGEDDIEFLAMLDSIGKEQSKKMTAKDFSNTRLLKFVRKFKNAFETILEVEDQRAVLESGKALTVSFGTTNAYNNDSVQELITHSKLIFVESSHEEVGFLSMVSFFLNLASTNLVN